MDAPQQPAKIVILPEYPAPGRRYLVERDGAQEIWLVKDRPRTAGKRLSNALMVGPGMFQNPTKKVGLCKAPFIEGQTA